MSTSIGGTGYNGTILTVISTEASNTIKRGMVCAFSLAASNPTVAFLDGTVSQDYKAGGGTPATIRQTDIPLFQVVRGNVDDTVLGNIVNIGIAKADILPGKVGEVVCFGLARVLANGAINAGEVISSAASGKVLDAANATHKNPIGIQVEAVSAADATAETLRWAFVNFTNSFSNAASGAAYAQLSRFMGKAY